MNYRYRYDPTASYRVINRGDCPIWDYFIIHLRVRTGRAEVLPVNALYKNLQMSDSIATDGPQTKIASYLSTFTANPIIYDGVVFFIAGGCIEVIRRGVTTIITLAQDHFIEKLRVSAEFDDKEEPFSESYLVYFHYVYYL